MTRLVVTLAETLFDAVAAHADFMAAEGAAGAVATFAGTVRDEGGSVDHLYLDWYPGMTEASMQTIAEAAAGRFDLLGLTVIHRCGRVTAGETIVFVAAASRHRRDALQAVDYVMDRLKSEAAFWKREGGGSGERWVEPRAADSEDLKRWNND